MRKIHVIHRKLKIKPEELSSIKQNPQILQEEVPLEALKFRNFAYSSFRHFCCHKLKHLWRGVTFDKITIGIIYIHFYQLGIKKKVTSATKNFIEEVATC